MSLLLETIKIEDGKICNLHYHQKRCDKSRQILFKTNTELDLSLHIHAPQKGLYRCRILYDTKVHSIEYIPYIPKEIKRLKLIVSEIDYALKYADRDALNALLETHKEVDEVLIEKGGYITDTTITNIAFYDGKKWLTPAKPLLEGTMRAKLLDEGLLQTANITPKDLSSYTQVALINAMVGFKILNQVSIQDLEGKTYDY